MTFWADMASTATELLAEFGAPVTIRRTTGGTYTPSSDTTSGETTADYTATGMVRDYRAGQIDGTVIRQGDRELVLDATVTPTVGDTVLIDSAYWSVVSVRSVNPAGTPVAHFVQVRR